MKTLSVTEQLQELDAKKARIIQNQRERFVRGLGKFVEAHSYKSIDEALSECFSLLPPATRAKLSGLGSVSSPEKPSPKRQRGRQNRLTAEQKEAVRKDLEEKKLTLSEMSGKHGVSLSVLSVWRKAWGLKKNASLKLK